MTSGNILIKAVAKNASEAVTNELPPGVVRFELEYDRTPDLAAEKSTLATYLAIGNFELLQLHHEIPNILILQFPEVKRTISRRGQFAIAAELAKVLNLRSCIPEGTSNFPVEREVGDEDAEGAIGDAILDQTCWSQVNSSLPPAWVADRLNVHEAWEKTRGAGVRIAQPDTGVAAHHLIDNILDLRNAFDAFTGKAGEATDPLDPSMGHPGHGTATSSVIASRHSDIVLGIAPEATLVPIRCINSVIFTLDGSLIARAIMHAREINADIISLSLGGPFISRSIVRALQLAVDSGMIVVAAAGNCVGVVVYPAFDENALAVAGVGSDDAPWKGTSRGAEIDIAAPSENVFAARRSVDDGGQEAVKQSQGTSFGTALTSGTAALWIAHHSRDAVRARAAQLGMSVNDLFRAAIRQTARRPANGWDPGLGAGIVDATALLALELDRIAPLHRAEIASALPSPLSQHSQIARLAQLGETVDGFDWRRHGAEALYLSAESLSRSVPALAALSETPAKPDPSEPLAATRLPDVLQKVLERLEDGPEVSMPTPWIIRGRAGSVFGDISRGGLEDLAKVRARREAVETTINGASSGAGLEGLVRSGEKIIAGLNAARQDSQAVFERNKVLQDSLEAYRQIESGRDPAELSLEARLGFEALVRLTGRPALKVIGDTISEDDPMFGDGGWGGILKGWPGLSRITKATGRINLGNRHIGTGFVLGDDVVMTNRHVLEVIGEEVASTKCRRWIFPYGTPSIDFSDKGFDGPAFDVIDVIFAEPTATYGRVNFKVLDLVLLKVRPGSGFPEPLAPRTTGTLFREDSELFVLGYPARPGASAFVDPSTGKYSQEISDRLGRIFGLNYGCKYISPGLVTKAPGDFGARDPRNWVFAHDATTCGGNSGSLVMAFGGNDEVAGLHFAGAPLSGNFGHDLTRVDLAEKLGG